MSLIIASQMEKGFNDLLATHPSRPRFIDVSEAEPWEAANDADVLLVRPSPAWIGNKGLARPAAWPGRLKWVYSASVGVDFYPPWVLQAPLVTCGRGVASDEIADYVIAAIYTHSKNLQSASVTSREDWRQVPLGRVAGTTLGIVGFGAIGEAVARRALALGINVTAVRRRSLSSNVIGVELKANLTEVIASADHIVLALPGTPQTCKLISAEVLSHARPHAHLINIARGSVLDQEALISALDAGQLAFATLDVTEPEPLPAGHALYSHPKVRLTPHISSNYQAVRHRLLEKISEDLTRFVRGDQPSDVVDPQAGY